MNISSLVDQNRFPGKLAHHLEQLLKLTEIEDLASHWALSTPKGRAWLLGSVNLAGQDEDEGADYVTNEYLRESEILKWAFVSELMQIADFDEALALVEWGITIRSLVSDPTEDLALQALACIKDELEGDISSQKLLEMEPKNPILAPEVYVLARSSIDGFSEAGRGSEYSEIDLRDHLLREFDGIKEKLEDLQVQRLFDFGIPLEKSRSLMRLGITLDDILNKSARELANHQWSKILERVREGEGVSSAMEEVIADNELVERILPSDRSNSRLDEPSLTERGEFWLEVDQYKVWKSEALRKVDSEDRVEGLFKIDFYDLIAVSDFHIAAGNHPTPEGISRFSPTEDFYFDDAFFRCLHHLQSERSNRGGYPAELVLNGDSIDFAQIVVRRPSGDQYNVCDIPPIIGLPESQFQIRFFKFLDEGQQDPDFVERVKDVQSSWFRDASIKRIEMKLRDTERQIMPQVMDDNFSANKIMAQIEGDLIRQSDQSWAEEPWVKWNESDWEKNRSPLRDGRQSLVAQPRAGLVSNALGIPNQVRHDEWDKWSRDAWLKSFEDRTEFEPREILAMDRKVAMRQLADVYLGHQRLFQALAWFLAQGNRLVVTRGNHDPQLYWPEVQLGFIAWLKVAYEELRLSSNQRATYEMPVPAEELSLTLPETTLEDFETRVDFDRGWIYYRDRLAYLEHGNQHDLLDVQRYFLKPVVSTGEVGGDELFDPAISKRPPMLEEWLPGLVASSAETRIDPPVGSLGLVHLVNRLEIEMPNFEQPGYAKVYLPWLVFRRPLLFMKVVGQGLWKVLTSWRRWSFSGLTSISRTYSVRVAEYAALTGLPESRVAMLDRSKWVRRMRGGVFSWIFRNLIAIGLVLPTILFVVVFFLPTIPQLSFIFDSDSSTRPWVLDEVVKLLMRLGSAFLAFWLSRGVLRLIGLGHDYVFRPSRDIVKILVEAGFDVPYLLFGHDHGHNVQAITPAADPWRIRLARRLRAFLGRKGKQESRWKTNMADDQTGRWYINTGTWLHMHAKERKRLIRGPHEYTFARMTNTQRVLAAKDDDYMLPRAHCRPVVQLLRWNDQVGKVEPTETFAGLVEDKSARTPPRMTSSV